MLLIFLWKQTFLFLIFERRNHITFVVNTYNFVSLRFSYDTGLICCIVCLYVSLSSVKETGVCIRYNVHNVRVKLFVFVLSVDSELFVKQEGYCPALILPTHTLRSFIC